MQISPMKSISPTPGEPSATPALRTYWGKYIADQVMMMRQGAVVEMADSDELYRDPKHPSRARCWRPWRGAAEGRQGGG